jgi:hypothetical protein
MSGVTEVLCYGTAVYGRTRLIETAALITGVGLIRFGGQVNYVDSAPRPFVFEVDHRRSTAVTWASADDTWLPSSAPS